MKNILIGITGGIAAYKSIELINLLKKKDFDIKVITTPNALNFVTKLTLQTISRNKVYVDEFDVSNFCIDHIELTKWAELFLIAPITANSLAKLANGIADNLLTSTVLALTNSKKLLLAPAMNENMWNNPCTQNNIKKISEYYPNSIIINPRKSVLACGDTGFGAMEKIENILEYIEELNA